MAPIRRISFFALVLTAGCASGGTGTKKSKVDAREAAQKYYEVAVGSFHNGMYEDARMQIDNALRNDPKHADSLYLMGLISLQDGKKIIDAVGGMACLTDESAESQRTRADEAHRSAHTSFSEAVAAYEDNSPGRGRAYNSMSVVSLHFGEWDRAIEEARLALATQFYGERFSALANLGWAFHQRGDAVDAMTELRQAVMMNPGYCVGRYRLASVYLGQEMNEAALEEITAVIDDPRCPIQDAFRIHGLAQARLGLNSDAVGAFQTCVDMAPRSCLAADCSQLLASATSGPALAAQPKG